MFQPPVFEEQHPEGKGAEAIAALRNELTCFRQNGLPSFVLCISDVSPAKQVLDDEHLVPNRNMAEGPFEVFADIRGVEGTAYSGVYQVGLKVSNKWPQVVPEVRVCSPITHAFVTDLGFLPACFYTALSEKQGNTPGTLLSVLEAVRTFLCSPLEFTGIKTKDLPQSFTFNMSASEHRETEKKRVISAYGAQCKHRMLFQRPAAWKEEWFHPDFWKSWKAFQGAKEGEKGAVWEREKGRLFNAEVPEAVFTFPFLSDALTGALLEEVDAFAASNLPAHRPNSMNSYGLILDDIGMTPFVLALREEILKPLAEAFFPLEGHGIDGHHCFTVRYKKGEDLGLDVHTDDSDVTFNICLGKDFKGGHLVVCGGMGAPEHRQHSVSLHHRPGVCVIHLGRRRHGAQDIEDGERINLIVWTRSSLYRRSEEYNDPDYWEESAPPDPRCLSYTHDRDYGVFLPYESGGGQAPDEYKGKGWCPPKPCEYPGFVSETLVPPRRASNGR
uniref:Fe2OG dioxygenase domain-containing protein n=1 Tax=Chromera velia CCMP2878 TaxID=1169474 RepID=A0A0G4FYD7_9ALVE|eukprot:Cvel_19392.t1-p1 / transcript=Cvel_19392.t1 / gene=Cvel_19392 / organism=Chromera_velia_CCMP2878 / gene_product=2-oxoglutarate and iron-dependent oxygenase, putative / transcript_product=2-oxoglutarate and iron-dependent oxygenase, putative / location=Cvel_scaffold1668:16304-18781(-) / protein_length=499 / sequence_SO=supercontig / SO=protein_coding / is_pseudo=false